MAQATWNGTVIAESDQTVMVEGNHYFPAESVKGEFLKPSELKTMCGWKGEASYCHVEAEGKTAENAAFTYADPKPEASHIKGYVAFWNGVEVDGDAGPDATPDGAACEI